MDKGLPFQAPPLHQHPYAAQGQKGQVVEFSMPMDASNVQPLGLDGKPIRHDEVPKAGAQPNA